MVKSDMASQWRVLGGENNWDGLLQPLNLDLRSYIIHYGQRAGSVGDLYNQNKHGEFPKDKFFAEAGLEKGNDFKYSVTHYIHAGSVIVEPAWFGFVAVTTDEGKAVLGRRDILIAWRGTIHYTEWFNDLISDPRPASELFGTGTEAKVHSGFLSNSVVDNLSARHQVRDALRELMDIYKGEEISITVTGFSLGGALATLNAMDIVANGYNKPSSTLLGANNPCMVTTFTFGSPQKIVDHHHLRLLRIRNANDPVHKWPFCTLNHVGKTLTVYSNESPYLKKKWLFASRGLLINWVADSVSAHNMDVYLHGIAGVQKGTSGFHLEVDLDIALVNKYLDRLKDEYGIPDHWWEGENSQRMVQEDNGHWKVNFSSAIS
ncbi:phospholipase A1-II 7-like [Gossypium australe]|uniref:Phospholipase A1 n=1 Tax=Gossypium australe TaxID=47621 RepID=A0A5B6VQ46_9ROSI|nr:phospholipase A1-II 7-like [Gossypium australe]